jgi:LytS/YehU family sensor histidine kinase
VLKQIREVTIVKHQRESELQLLRSQLSPHFLFNVLNNLYGLAIRQDQKVPGMILKLSDLLRYSLYDTNHDFVQLTDELDYIANYMELESTRIGEHLLLESNIQKTNLGGIKIAPMLLIVFVENAFKHSKDTLQRDIQIKVGLRVSEDNLVFEVRNSFSDAKAKQKTAEDSGIGLAVTMKRLELLYPGRYSLDTSKENGYYTVKLQLKIK